MKRYFKIYRVFFAQYIKQLIQYRVDFSIGIFSFLLVQFSGILFIGLVFESIHSLNGWSLNQMVFLYGFFQIPRGLDHLFTDNIWLIPNKVRRGDVDRYLVRPINPLFQCVSERFQPEAFGELAIGVILIAWTSARMNIAFTPQMFAITILLIFSGALIYTSIKLLGATTGFWIMNSMPLMTFVYGFADFAKYPTVIFPKIIQVLVTVIFPFAFVSFYPASYLLGMSDPIFVVLGSLAASSIFAIISYQFWKFGLANYTSAGN